MKELVKGYATFRIDYNTNTNLETLYAERDNGQILVTAERPYSDHWPEHDEVWEDSGHTHESLKAVAMFIGNYQIEI